jgi:DNA-binding HxlR family transcriptional regulator
MGLLWETSYLEETTSITMKKQELDQNVCKAHHLAIRDTMELLSGKWKIRIIGALSFGPMRFMELKDSIEGIAAKMLSKELLDLDLNGMVDRRVLNSKPISVQYELTEYGRSVTPIIEVIAQWGKQHRYRLMHEMKSH